MQLYLGSDTPKYMERFIHFACAELGLDRLRGEVSVYLTRRLDEESFGLCWGDRHEAEIHVASTQWGAPVSREDKLKTLAHELTHAYQYLTGSLKCDITDDFIKSTWHKKVYRYLPEEESNLPWEIEARQQEERIYEEWVSRGYK